MVKIWVLAKIDQYQDGLIVGNLVMVSILAIHYVYWLVVNHRCESIFIGHYSLLRQSITSQGTC